MESFPDQWGRALKKMNKSQFALLTQRSRTIQPSQWGTSHSWWGTQERWCFRDRRKPQRQVMTVLPESIVEQLELAAAASHYLKAAHHLTNISWASTAPCSSPAIAPGWEACKPCRKIKSYRWPTPVNHLPAPSKPWADVPTICQLAICTTSSK